MCEIFYIFNAAKIGGNFCASDWYLENRCQRKSDNDVMLFEQFEPLYYNSTTNPSRLLRVSSVGMSSPIPKFVNVLSTLVIGHEVIPPTRFRFSTKSTSLITTSKQVKCQKCFTVFRTQRLITCNPINVLQVMSFSSSEFLYL